MRVHPGLRTAFKIFEANRTVLGKPAERVKAPYVKHDETEQDPEYHETRGTLGNQGTTPKAKYYLVTDSA